MLYYYFVILFPDSKNVVEVIRGTNKSLNNSKRDIDREIRNINRQEKKLEADIKKLANEVRSHMELCYLIYSSINELGTN